MHIMSDFLLSGRDFILAFLSPTTVKVYREHCQLVH